MIINVIITAVIMVQRDLLTMINVSKLLNELWEFCHDFQFCQK